jgi:hypothetical protein
VKTDNTVRPIAIKTAPRRKGEENGTYLLLCDQDVVVSRRSGILLPVIVPVLSRRSVGVGREQACVLGRTHRGGGAALVVAADRIAVTVSSVAAQVAARRLRAVARAALPAAPRRLSPRHPSRGQWQFRDPVWRGFPRARAAGRATASLGRHQSCRTDLQRRQRISFPTLNMSSVRGASE